MNTGRRVRLRAITFDPASDRNGVRALQETRDALRSFRILDNDHVIGFALERVWKEQTRFLYWRAPWNGWKPNPLPETLLYGGGLHRPLLSEETMAVALYEPLLSEYELRLLNRYAKDAPRDVTQINAAFELAPSRPYFARFEPGSLGRGLLA